MGRARTGPLPAHSSHYRLDSPVGLDKMEAEMEGVDEQLEVGQCAVDDALARVLRIVLSSNQPIPHHLLKSKALGNAGVRDASKCVFDIALLTLVEHGLLTRHGYGNWALYTIPPESLHVATELAFAEFPTDERTFDQPLVMHALHHQPHGSPCGVASLRRASSPRPRRSLGIEKGTSGAQRLRSAGAGKRSWDEPASVRKKSRVSAGLGGVSAPSNEAVPMSP